MTKAYFILIPIIAINLIYSQDVQIKDTTDQLLFQINDEGDNKSSVTVPSSASSPSVIDNKLYNESGTLKWNGNALGLVGSADGDWTVSGSNIYPTVAGNVGIGTTNPLSRLSIGNDGNNSWKLYAKSTKNYGHSIHGESAGENGIAIRGKATHTITKNYGGYFSADGSIGIAVYGIASNTGTLRNFGGYFEAESEDGVAVYGVASGSKSTMGGWFRSFGIAGSGIYVSDLNTQNTPYQSYGGYFATIAPKGIAVYAHANNALNINCAIRGKTESPFGWAGYFEGRGYFSDKVGIGITNPVSNLHINGLEGLLVNGGAVDSGTEQNLGSGQRLHFYGNRAAFRAGEIDGTEWDHSNLGYYSAAFGHNTIASGTGSTSFGTGSEASASNSTALGYYTSANGNIAVSMGYYTQAQSYASLAIGRFNVGGGSVGGWELTDPVFEIGIGTDGDNKENAVTVLKNGKTGIGTATPNVSFEVIGTDAILVPVGTTGERPSSPQVGLIRFNTVTSKFEGYDGSSWVNLH